MRKILEFLFFLLIQGAHVLSSQCPGQDWFYRRDTKDCFYVFDPKSVAGEDFFGVPSRPKLRYDEAVLECQIRGGQIATFQSAEELEWVKAKLTDRSAYFWIGLTYESGAWQWSNGTSLWTYQPIVGLNAVAPLNTASSPAKNARGTLKFDSSRNAFVFASRLNSTYEKNGYICRGDWSARPWCKTEDGWDYYDGTCHKFYVDRESWDEAQSTCRADNGNLVVVTSALEDERMKNWLRHDLDVESGWLGIKFTKEATTTPDSVQWLDGTPIIGSPVNNWDIKDLAKFIRDAPVGRSYCGAVTTKPEEWVVDDWYGIFEYYEDEVHDWRLSEDCSRRLPFFCEAPLNQCPYGWHQWKDTCYQIHAGQANMENYNIAQAKCLALAGDLAVVKSSEVQDFLTSVIKEDQINQDASINHFWIGLRASNGRFTWRDNSPLGYQSWSGGQMPSAAQDPCVYVDGNPIDNVVDGHWLTSSCSQRRGFICQAATSAPIPFDTDAVIHPALKCIAPFVKYHEGCYLPVRQAMNHDAAQDYCKSQQASYLAYPNAFGENVWLHSQAAGDIWLGIQRKGELNSWFEWEYSDKEYMGPGSFKNFKTAPGAVLDTDQNFCVMMSKSADPGYWFLTNCTVEKPFICYHKGEPAPLEPLDPIHSTDKECGAGWIRNGTNCYRIHSEASRRNRARQYCHNMGGDSDLLYILNKAEEDFISDLVTSDFSIVEENYWLGLYSEKEDEWYWQSRTSTNKWHYPLALTNWGYGEPDETGWVSQYSPRCAYMDNAMRDPQWYAAECSESHSFICKKTISKPPVASTPAPTPAAGEHLGCPQYWFPFNGHCAQIEHVATDWLNAHQICQSRKGSLVTLHDEMEMRELSQFAEGAWTGLNARDNPQWPRVFIYTSGEEVLYTPWDATSAASAVMGSHVGDVNCVAMVEEGFAVYPCSEKRRFVCERPLESVLSTGTPHHPDFSRGCKPKGVRHHENCYYFGEDPTSDSGRKPPLTFDKAREFCRTNYQSELTTITSESEQDFLNAVLPRYQADFWIGLQEPTGIWGVSFQTWVDNSEVTYTNWAPNQPPPPATDAGFQGCVALHGIYREHRLPGDWYVDQCSDTKFALCKGESDHHETHPPTPTTPIPTGCPSGWTTERELTKCYKSYSGYQVGAASPSVKVTWQEAEDFCKNYRGGHLVSIENEEEQHYVHDLTTSHQYWIGLRRWPDDKNKWKWSDDTPTKFMYWHESYHEDELAQSNCVTLDRASARWFPQGCNNAWGWVCEIPKGRYFEGEVSPEFPTAAPPNVTCGPSTAEGSWHFDQKSLECIYVSKKPDSWSNAQSQCEAMGANLITVTGASYEFVQLKAAQASTTPRKFWIGLYQTDMAGKVFSWVDGHFSDFRAWELGQPHPHGTERCVAHHSKTGRWTDENCGHDYLYVCAKTGRIRPAGEPTHAPDVGGCAPDWVAYGSHCYFISGNENRTWDEAHRLCTKDLTVDNKLPVGELVSIHHRSENNFLITQMKGRHHYSFWTGLHESSERVWVWSDQSDIRYINWHVGEPMSSTGELECVSFGSGLRQAGRWMVEKCRTKKGFICKARKDPTLSVPASAAGKCGADFPQFGDEACFVAKKLEAGRTDWTSARNLCKSIGDGHGDIATVIDVFDNARFNLLLNEVDDTRNASAWIGMTEHLGNFAWHNSCPVTFTNFLSLTAPPDDACVRIGHDGKWNTTTCGTAAEYVICERRFKACEPTHEHRPGAYCPENFPHECADVCFRVQGPAARDDGETDFSRERAQEECIKHKGVLASIRSASEQQCLNGYMSHHTSPMWFGLYQAVDTTSGQNVWRWEDEAYGDWATSFLNWQTAHPTNISTDTCGAMQPNGSWISTYCDSWRSGPKGYICEAPKLYGPVNTPQNGPSPSSASTDDGLSGGAVAGIVIGVLIGVAILATVGYVVMAGKTSAVVSSVRTVSSKVKTTATSRFARTGFTNKTYARQDDKQPVAEDPEYQGGDSYT